MNNIKQLTLLAILSCFHVYAIDINTIAKGTIPQIMAKLNTSDGSADYVVFYKFWKGIACEQNKTLAMLSLKKAADKGNPLALYQLAIQYRKGEGVEHNKSKTFELLTQAAQKNYPQAQYELGAMLLNGFLCNVSAPEGIMWIKKAAENNHSGALDALGQLAQEGVDDSCNRIEPDYTKALDLFKRSAAAGNTIAKYNLIQFYLAGLGGNKNKREVQRLTAEIMRSEGPESIFYQGLLYETGSGVSKSIKKAKDHYEIIINNVSLKNDPLEESARKGLERINEKLEKQSSLEKELLHQTELPSHKKTVNKKSISPHQDNAAAQPTEPEALLPDIDITGYTLKNLLNKQLSYDDGSTIADFNTENQTIILANPSDNSSVTIIYDEQRQITPRILNALKKFTYDERVQKWFSTPIKELLKNNSQESIDRHRFAQRVDEIVQIYGSKATFMKKDGTLEKNKVLNCSITTKDKRTLAGTLEFAYYKRGSEKILYHRFLHPHSRSIT